VKCCCDRAAAAQSAVVSACTVASRPPDDMGCAGSKAGDEQPQQMGGGTAESSATPEKVKTFRERRLSVSQEQAKDGPRRRLSVYGGNGEDAQPSEVKSPIAYCGAKTMGGFEPVPGGSVAKINQDRGMAIYPFLSDDRCGIFGVYDGHGRAGEKVSEFVLQNLPGELTSRAEQLISEPGEALKQAYVAVDDDLAKSVDASVSGTTAVTCLIKERHCWLANSGDSRAVVMRKVPNGLKAIDLTVDHKPDSPGEMKRILQMGGHVTPAGANGSPARVWHNLRGLAMARSIGDHAAATVGVIAEPEITEYDITDDDYCLVVASDGVWELLTSQQVADIAYGVKSGDVQEMCEVISDQSSYMWKVEEGDYRDDITVVIIKFDKGEWLPPAGS